MSKGNNFVKHGKFGSYVDVDAVVDAIRYHNNFITIYGKTNEEVWTYEEGIWKPNGREIIETATEELLAEWAKTKVVNEIFKKVKRQTSISREEFDTIPDELIPLQNGILNFKTGEFLDYSPEYYFKTKLSPVYDKTKGCSQFLNFIGEIISPDDIPVIQEWYGYCLYRRYLIKKGIIFVGEQDTGKTVLLSNLVNFIGKENTTGINLQRITNEDKFALASLYWKYLNAYDDLSSKDINNGGGFKIVTGGGFNTAEIKFGDPFQFINFAKMTFACNKIPPIKDSDDLAYYNRFMPIEFNNPVEDLKKDLYLIDKIITKDEISGILNWALEGLTRLLEQGKFSYNKPSEEVKRIMDRSGDSLAGFVQDCLIKCEESKISKEKMYEIYSFWVEQTKVTRYSKEQIGRRLEKYCPFVTAKTGKERYWVGADVKWDILEQKINLDTLDTFKNIYIGIGNSYYRLDIIQKEVSNPSKDIEEDKNTLDAFSKEDKQNEELLDEDKKLLEDFEQ